MGEAGLLEGIVESMLDIVGGSLGCRDGSFLC